MRGGARRLKCGCLAGGGRWSFETGGATARVSRRCASCHPSAMPRLHGPRLHGRVRWSPAEPGARLYGRQRRGRGPADRPGCLLEQQGWAAAARAASWLPRCAVGPLCTRPLLACICCWSNARSHHPQACGRAGAVHALTWSSDCVFLLAGISNGRFGEWPKVTRGLEQLQAILQADLTGEGPGAGGAHFPAPCALGLPRLPRPTLADCKRPRKRLSSAPSMPSTLLSPPELVLSHATLAGAQPRACPGTACLGPS